MLEKVEHSLENHYVNTDKNLKDIKKLEKEILNLKTSDKNEKAISSILENYFSSFVGQIELTKNIT
jgi:hypothetical protein